MYRVLYDQNSSGKEKKMKKFLAVAGPFAFTFIFWGVIASIPMPALILLPLVISSGVLMLWEIVYLQKIMNKHQ